MLFDTSIGTMLQEQLVYELFFGEYSHPLSMLEFSFHLVKQLPWLFYFSGNAVFFSSIRCCGLSP